MKDYDVDLHFENISEKEHKELMKLYFKIMMATEGKCSSNTTTKIIKDG